ncbi:MAG: hypothetical protein ABSE91_04295 [Patescibacteria group bacterium]
MYIFIIHQNSNFKALFTGTKPTPTTSATSTKTQAKTIGASAITLVEKKSGYCKALVPNDWSFTSISPYVGADIFSADKTIHAGWGIAGIYKALYPTTESALTYLQTAVGYKDFTLTSAQKDLGNGFYIRDFSSSIGQKGEVIYQVYNFDTSFYVISVYMASANNNLWDSKGALALSSAISIRCVSQLRPTTASVDYSSSDPSSAADNPEVDLSDQWTEAIMGYEDVYSPTTGDHYEAPLNSYWAGGPDGGGYYRDLPNGGYEKLSEGFGDY